MFDELGGRRGGLATFMQLGLLSFLVLFFVVGASISLTSLRGVMAW